MERIKTKANSVDTNRGENLVSVPATYTGSLHFTLLCIIKRISYKKTQIHGRNYELYTDMLFAVSINFAA
jgi:hypothetical protein